ncbi:hypothetical protein EAM_0536 [Erwinia amylovora ATCC 49946]|nr:hypothetical protein EAM_0536 [Erwinia amylovora ATCC 49946]
MLLVAVHPVSPCPFFLLRLPVAIISGSVSIVVNLIKKRICILRSELRSGASEGFASALRR